MSTEVNLQSRILSALAAEGQAPEIFRKKPWLQVPIYSVLFSALPPLIAFFSTSSYANVYYKLTDL